MTKRWRVDYLKATNFGNIPHQYQLVSTLFFTANNQDEAEEKAWDAMAEGVDNFSLQEAPELKLAK